MPNEVDLNPLLSFLKRIPAVDSRLGGGLDGEMWWVKFTITIDHSLAWQTVQELGHVLNYLSLDDRLPTVFKPVSPPPYMNGGPEFLSWVIECQHPEFTPETCAKWLESRMPDPVDDPAAWALGGDTGKV